MNKTELHNSLAPAGPMPRYVPSNSSSSIDPPSSNVGVPFSRLRFGQLVIVSFLSFYLNHVPFTLNYVLPGILIASILCIMSEYAEIHEGSDVPKSMTPPTIEEIERSLQSQVVPPGEDTSDDDDSASGEDVEVVEKPGLIWREQDGKSVLVPSFYPPKSSKNLLNRPLTMSEVSSHNTRSSCWVVVESHVYDITRYIDHHPGGWLPLTNMAGKDCTDAFANYHPANIYKDMLPSFYIGDVTDSLDGTEFVKEHRAIRQELLRRGLFETNSYYYYLKIVWLSFLLVSAVSLTLLGPSKSFRLGGAVFMAAFWQQLAFIGHDVGHNAISHKKWKDTTLGIIFGNTLGGISLGWWKHSHNVHHIVCNSVEHDPDIQHMPLFAVTDEIFDAEKLQEAGVYDDEKQGFWSTYHMKWISTDVVSRFLVSNQHYLFYPIMAVARFNLYIQGFIYVATAWSQDAWFAKRFQKLEFVTLLGFLTWLTLLVSSLPTPTERLHWLLLSHALAGWLHVQICISHFTMDTYHGHAYNGPQDDWFKMQCFTTMNVDSYRWSDFVHGGLQFQIEHHLYPRLPRHNLREARALVKPFCLKHSVPYHELGFYDSNVELVNGLKSVAMKCREYGLKGVGGFKESQIYEGLNAIG
ncbi:hypothetical protein TrVE_jg10249 [Triparma verrucosa]|uniref:Cytochrome b5 heme-binding domain-containing protein n=1 Tax=Triparma verrucosa TaxID=1606542 RepID=A0A9W7ELZ5_9STRA|nr:hypothetical protein TrVE_jg10249 [Triparma verrucosa]